MLFHSFILWPAALNTLVPGAYIAVKTAMCLLTGLALGFPSVAWYRRTKEKQRADEHVRFLALHDAMTGLPNRALLIDRNHEDNVHDVELRR